MPIVKSLVLKFDLVIEVMFSVLLFVLVIVMVWVCGVFEVIVPKSMMLLVI